jgi:serine/threonine protein kinase/dipeptidyl aminopeptidase/acylaminoacyl peptidase
MSLEVGSRIGAYDITGLLGTGGMGEVYRGRDARLQRDVAIKVLPGEFAHEPERLARFEREAQLLAALNHPHIAAIYELEEIAAGGRALVLELVDGPTLAERIARGPLPIAESVAIARQIAMALEAAHDAAIVHRDLKPANIKLTSTDRVKVLDFGIAKALEPAGRAARMDPSVSPTFTRPTELGIIMGTAAYMAPEQARGKLVDRRADIWAFGVVLYEMLTGRRAFTGEEITDVLAKVIERDPDWSALPPATPASIRRLLRRCLQKDPAARLQHIGDARLELEEPADEPPSFAPPASFPTRERALWGTLAAILALAAIALGLRAWRPVAPAPGLRVDIVTPPPLDSSLAISPDGRKVAFVAADINRWLLWVRDLESGALRALPGTEGGRLPFWSSDSASLGFFTEAQMKRVDIAGGSPQVLAATMTPGGGTWSGDTIVFASNSSVGPLFRIAASGGDPVPITQPSDPEIGHRHPEFLPDGRHFLYAANTVSGVTRHYVGDLGGSPPRHLFDADGSPVYSGSGHVLFVRNGTLFAQAFDAPSATLRGTPVSIADKITVLGTSARSAVSASATGAIIYRTGLDVGRRQLVWLDRSGKELERLLSGDLSTIANPWLSPDGRRAVVQATTNGNPDVYILDLGRGTFNRFTSHPAPDALPVWSPDGQRIVFNSLRRGVSDLYVRAADGGGEEQLLLVSTVHKRASDWSRDGRMLLFKTVDPIIGASDIWAMPVDDPQKAFAVVATRADERDAQFSPDGKWIAYQSDETGRPEIYVQRFPGPGGKERVSTGGGTQVRWRPDGKEIFYVDAENTLMAASIHLPPGDGGAVDVGKPLALFASRLVQAGLAVARQQYAVSPDGQRFLANTIEQPTTAAITLLLNWSGR